MELTFEELLEPVHAGEHELKNKLRESGYKVRDVSNNPSFWRKDIDLLATNPRTHITTSIEVKWDSKVADTNNIYIEISNPRSKGGKGWFSFCEADVLAYGDAVNNKFYMFKLPALKQFIKVNKNKLETRRTADGAIGYLVNLSSVAGLANVVSVA